LILEERIVEVTYKDVLSIKTSVNSVESDAKAISEIRKQIENQRATIDLVATDAQNAKRLSEQASNKLVTADKKLKYLDDAIYRANVANTRLSLLVKIDAATQYGLGLGELSRGDLDELITIQNPTNDLNTTAIGRLLFMKLRMVYDAADHNGPYLPNSNLIIYEDGTYSHLNVLGHIARVRDSHGLLTSLVVSNTLNDPLLIDVAAGFQKLFDIGNGAVKTFDFEGLNKWVKDHPKEMRETFPLPP